MELEGDERDPEAARLQAEHARKRLRASEREKEGFRTQAMRDAERLRDAAVYTSTVIRVLCPDRTVLQAVFGPLEPVAAVHAWVRSLMADADAGAGADPGADAAAAMANAETGAAAPEAAPVPASSAAVLPPRFAFYLYQTPPPAELAPSARTLAEARLLPAALLHLGWGSGPGSGPGRKLARPPTEPRQWLSEAAYAAAAADAADAAASSSSASARAAAAAAEA
jgi:hypothetical protein